MSKTMQWIMSLPIEKQEEIFRTDPRADDYPEEETHWETGDADDTEDFEGDLPF